MNYRCQNQNERTMKCSEATFPPFSRETLQHWSVQNETDRYRPEIDGAVGMNSGIFNNPFIIWGKYHKGLFKITLKFSFQFHHTQMDGAHAGRFLQRLQENIFELKSGNFLTVMMLLSVGLVLLYAGVCQMVDSTCFISRFYQNRLTSPSFRYIMQVIYNSNYIWRCEHACESKSHKRNDR